MNIMEPYKFEPHSFTRHTKRLGWAFCAHCGIVQMKNSFSLWIQAIGCDWEKHKDYKNKRNSRW